MILLKRKPIEVSIEKEISRPQLPCDIKSDGIDTDSLKLLPKDIISLIASLIGDKRDNIKEYDEDMNQKLKYFALDNYPNIKLRDVLLDKMGDQVGHGVMIAMKKFANGGTYAPTKTLEISTGKKVETKPKKKNVSNPETSHSKTLPIGDAQRPVQWLGFDKPDFIEQGNMDYYNDYPEGFPKKKNPIKYQLDKYKKKIKALNGLKLPNYQSGGFARYADGDQFNQPVNRTAQSMPQQNAGFSIEGPHTGGTTAVRNLQTEGNQVNQAWTGAGAYNVGTGMNWKTGNKNVNYTPQRYLGSEAEYKRIYGGGQKPTEQINTEQGSQLQDEWQQFQDRIASGDRTGTYRKGNQVVGRTSAGQEILLGSVNKAVDNNFERERLQKEYNEVDNKLKTLIRNSQNNEAIAQRNNYYGKYKQRLADIQSKLATLGNEESQETEQALATTMKKGGINIKPENKGKFTDYCGGKVTAECIEKGKNSPNPLTRKRATFAKNARSWSHKLGGKSQCMSCGGTHMGK